MAFEQANSLKSEIQIPEPKMASLTDTTTTPFIMTMPSESNHRAPERHDACQKVGGNDASVRKVCRGKMATTHEPADDFESDEFQEDADAWDSDFDRFDRLEDLEPPPEAYEFWPEEDEDSGETHHTR